MDPFASLRTQGATEILRQGPGLLSAVGSRGQNLLQEALSRRDTRSAIQLIDAGIEVDHQDQEGQTALHYAAIFANKEALRAVLDKGANTNILDVHGNGPLWRACIEDREPYEMVTLLIQAGADPDQFNRAGRSPLKLAAQTGNAALEHALRGVG